MRSAENRKIFLSEKKTKLVTKNTKQKFGQFYEYCRKASIRDALADHAGSEKKASDTFARWVKKDKFSKNLYPIGCAGKIISFSETNDRRFLIELEGIARFKLKSELDALKGFRRIIPDWRPFYKDLKNHIEKNYNSNDHLIVMGDLNISPQDIDIGIGEENKKRWLRSGKCSFLPEEREILKELTDWGLHDSYRTLFPEKNDVFSWFDYRSKGFEDTPKRGLRIDHIWVTKKLNAKIKDCGIDYDIRGMDKPSDHAPIWTLFDL